jgi:hypothetical protein
MFRFSIRELMLVTLVVATGLAWFGERRRAQAAFMDAKSAKERAKAADDLSEARWHLWKDEVDKVGSIQRQLPHYGLDIGWLVPDAPVVYKVWRDR